MFGLPRRREVLRSPCDRGSGRRPHRDNRSVFLANRTTRFLISSMDGRLAMGLLQRRSPEQAAVIHHVPACVASKEDWTEGGTMIDPYRYVDHDAYADRFRIRIDGMRHRCHQGDTKEIPSRADLGAAGRGTTTRQDFSDAVSCIREGVAATRSRPAAVPASPWPEVRNGGTAETKPIPGQQYTVSPPVGLERQGGRFSLISRGGRLPKDQARQPCCTSSANTSSRLSKSPPSNSSSSP